MRTTRDDYYAAYHLLRLCRSGRFVGLYVAPLGMVLSVQAGEIFVFSGCVGMNVAAFLLGVPYMDTGGNLTISASW